MKSIISLLLLACLGMAAAAEPAYEQVSISGRVTDAVDGEPLIGVTLMIAELNKTTVTDIDGRYTFNHLPPKTVTLQVSYIGHQTIIKTVNLAETSRLDFVMHESNAMINEVVVTGIAGSQLMKDSPTPISIVTLHDLQTTASTNIIDAIAHKPGLDQVTTGSGISKPVIRGLGYNRVVTVADGIRQEGQQWGDEHGIELDGQSVNSIEILKGPASLMYGSDAMAGVIIFHRRPSLPEGHISGSASAEYQSNNGLLAYSLNMGGNQRGTVWDLRYSHKLAHAYKNKYDGRVLGTQFAERALSGMAGINRRWGFSHLTLSHYHITPTMSEGERDEATGQFLQPVTGESEESLPATRHQLTTYGHGFPYQQIHHFKAVSDNSVYIGEGTLKAIVGYQNNRRQEFEEAETPDECGLDLMLHTLTYDLHYSWQNERGLKFNTGVGGMWQQSQNKGEEYLIPDYVLNDVGAFATTGYKTGGWSLNGGLRADRRHLHAFTLADRFTDFSRTFSTVTGSVGAVRDLGRCAHLKVNIARGFRAPNLSELGSNGEHEGTFRYEVGEHRLRPEYSWQADAGYDYSSDFVSAQVSLFVNLIDNYIFARRDAAITTDGLPTYLFTQGDARLIGGEASIDIHPIDRLHFENSLSYVDARQVHQPADRRYLPRTPAPRWMSDLQYDIIRDGRFLDNTFVRLSLECHLRQRHVFTADDTESITPSYTLLHLSAGTDIRHHRRVICTVSIHASNLADRAYQNHLSRLKYADVNPVTGRSGIYNMGRNVGIKVAVPLLILSRLGD